MPKMHRAFSNECRSVGPFRRMIRQSLRPMIRLFGVRAIPFSLALFSLLIDTCHARTFYVDQRDPNSRDFLTGGSESVPFKTLGAACNPRLSTRHFDSPPGLRPMAWIADRDYWTSLKSTKGGHKRDAPAGLCVVTGLKEESAPKK